MVRDPIEETEEYKRAMHIIQQELDKTNRIMDEQGMKMGRCHVYWKEQKEMLKFFNIDWRTPSEMNPHTRFD